MSLLILMIAAATAAAVSYALTPVTIALARRIGAVDLPSSRKVHEAPIPRLGGLAVIVAASVGFAITFYFSSHGVGPVDSANFWLALAAGLLPIVAVSIRDDIRPLRPLPKLIAQLLGAIMAVTLGVHLGPAIHLFGTTVTIGWTAIPLSILWMIGVTNAFNLVDGLDGLSAGLALISATSLGAVSVIAHKPMMGTASFILAAALLGFLRFNIYPARVFLGDTGATAAGFILACLALGGGSTLSAGMAILVPVLVLGLPIADTLVTIARRYLRTAKQTPWRPMFDPDRDHFHHRLMSLGLDHKQAVYVLYGAGLLFAGCAVISLFLTYTNAAILLVAMLIAAFVGVHKLGYDEFAFVRRGTILKGYEVPVLRSTLFAAFIDVTFVVVALYAAFVLKYDDWLVVSHHQQATQMLALVVAVFVPTLALFRVYKRSWRLATVEDLVRPVAGVLSGSAVSYVIANVFLDDPPPLSLYIIFTFLLMAMVTGSRASYRLLIQWNRQAAAEGEPVVIYGAGVGGTMAVREVMANSSLNMWPVGFIDDDPRLQGRIVHGLPVLGSLSSLQEILRSGRAAGVLLASHKLPPEKVSQAGEICNRTGRWMRYFRVDVSPAHQSSAMTTVNQPAVDEALQPTAEALANR